MEHIFRILDFNVYNEKDSSIDDDETSSDSDKENYNIKKDSTKFTIQIFGLNEKGKTCSIITEYYKPFFYVLVNDSWTIKIKNDFLAHIKNKIGKYYENSIRECIIIKRKKLCGFDGGKEHKFIKFEFTSMSAFNKVKNLWYTTYDKGHNLLKNGYNFNNTNIKLYEANIPPLLRFIHIQDISPSGWIALPKNKTIELTGVIQKTSCDFEYIINYKNIIPLNDKETRVPYKIMSFDIEASSSHGDFPVPVKTYKKLATNIIEYFEKLKIEITKESCKTILKKIILSAFGYEKMDMVDLVYPKKIPESKEILEEMCEKWLISQVRDLSKSNDYNTQTNTLEGLFEKMVDAGDEEDELEHNKFVKVYTDKKATIIDILCDKNFEREGKLSELNDSLQRIFPKLEGDKCTFIGSTFMKYGEQEPFMSHCIVLNTCSKLPLKNSVVESYNTEEEVLLAWKNLVQRENPDIIIGYNIFGFDYQFMFYRAEETNCIEEFLKLSRNKDEICATRDNETGKYKMEESSIQIASGQHDLKFIKINGRLQVDLYNFYRRETNLPSYKLDYVAGNFIGDSVKELDYNGLETKIKTGNMTGLLVGSYIHFEEIGHSVDYYDNGAKFLVTYVDKKDGKFKIEGIVTPDLNKKVRWCLAKDDVTPKDIFRMTNGSADDRAVIAKYCIQDCNLVHYLFNKSDILTGFIEMAKICSVPINFLVMRGQGIKLTSFVSKKCREKRTLMPVIEKGGLDEGYEGAFVLDPKCDLYLDNPVACNDYASLYPSVIISENFSHDSKVWTKEYDLDGVLIEDCGEKDENGNYIYDNLPGYEYVNCTYDTYKYVRKTPTSAAEKVKAGHKICRFVQPNDDDEGEAIMPSILKELLKARKDTRKLIPNEKDEFMKNVLEQRQLSYKVTANSLYGQCGAKTSTFYEKDIAACTTATGRLLLTYGKKIIEECYGNNICDTKNYGKVKTRAEYIYGDTDSVFYTFNLEDLDGNQIRGKKALEITIELAQQVGDISAKFLKSPHDFEYEKTYMPFCLLSKKRYFGMLYEKDLNVCKRKEMGIILKRNGNAPIVKDIYGGTIDILMIQQNIKQAIDYVKNCLNNIVNKNCPIDKLIITKSLRSGYKNPKAIAHKVLADRITSRDPGNKPSSGDKIPFVYIVSSNKKALQGEKIETPTFIVENNLKIDYSFYITNQIMKPIQQLFALVLEKIWEMQNKKPKIAKFKKDVEILRKNTDPEKFEDKLEQMKNNEVKALLFNEYLREINNEKEGVQSLTKFFNKKL
jgi:DNA polymerase elongation subunit (family B)